MKKVTIIGHFAFGLEYLDGQTVKTKIIANELCHRYGNDQIEKIDTHGGIKILLKAPFQIFHALKNSKNVIILPAHNGLRINAPLLSFMRNLFKDRRIHYVVIGGWLPEFLKNRKYLTKSLKSFDGIYVETKTMKKALNEQGFTNIFIMPNCKDLNILKESQLVYHNSEPYKLCTFSRVMKEKGIEDAVEAAVEKMGLVDPSLNLISETYNNNWSTLIADCNDMIAMYIMGEIDLDAWNSYVDSIVNSSDYQAVIAEFKAAAAENQ